jgi:pimeloyl-ACP methyl ester carboxylesterase
MPSRRAVLLSVPVLAAAGGAGYLFQANHSIPPADPLAEERFRELQALAMAHYGLPGVSKHLPLADSSLTVHAIDAGQGDPVLFLHGGNSVAAGWIPLLALLSDRYRTLAPDRPGCGLTTKLDYSGVPFRAHAVEFVRDVMDALGLEVASLVGNSMGGYFALVFALAEPERVSKLVLVGEPAERSGDTRGQPASGHANREFRSVRDRAQARRHGHAEQSREHARRTSRARAPGTRRLLDCGFGHPRCQRKLDHHERKLLRAARGRPFLAALDVELLTSAGARQSPAVDVTLVGRQGYVRPAEPRRRNGRPDARWTLQRRCRCGPPPLARLP